MIRSGQPDEIINEDDKQHALENMCAACAGTMPGILVACDRFLADGVHPCDQGFTWAPRPAWVTAADLPRLRQAADTLVG